MSTKDKPWRVRVLEQVEVWKDVRAETGQLAEASLIGKPGIVHVFARSAVPSDKEAASARPQGVEEE